MASNILTMASNLILSNGLQPTGDGLHNPKDCWYGRGVTQLTWPANYGMLQDIIQKVWRSACGNLE